MARSGETTHIDADLGDDHFRRSLLNPRNGLQALNDLRGPRTWPITMGTYVAVPRVSVRKRERKPINPRDGTENSKRTRLDPAWIIFVILPLRMAKS